MYLALQEGKTRMMRLRFADEYPATVATTLRMVAAMGLGKKSLPAGDKLCRVPWSSVNHGLRLAQQLQEKFDIEFTGCVKTADTGFPIEAMRWTPQSLERRRSCMFKLENEDLWVVLERCPLQNLHYDAWRLE